MTDDLISVGSLHALQYCERLFFLEEVERIRLADASVYAGRRLHEGLSQGADAPTERSLMKSEELGLIGAVDVNLDP